MWISRVECYLRAFISVFCQQNVFPSNFSLDFKAYVENRQEHLQTHVNAQCLHSICWNFDFVMWTFAYLSSIGGELATQKRTKEPFAIQMKMNSIDILIFHIFFLFACLRSLLIHSSQRGNSCAPVCAHYRTWILNVFDCSAITSMSLQISIMCIVRQYTNILYLIRERNHVLVAGLSLLLVFHV